MPNFRGPIDPFRMGRGFHLISEKNADGSFTVKAQGQPHLTATAETQELALRKFTDISREKIITNTEEIQILPVK